MNKRHFTLFSVIIMSLLLLCFVSCEESNVIPMGTLNLSISDSVTRAIEPNIPLDIAKYEVKLLNSDGTAIVSKVLDKSNPNCSQNNIPVGSYTVKVNAKNENGIVIGTGSESCIIEKDKTTDVSVSIREVSGTGTLSITLTGTVNADTSYYLNVYKSDNTSLDPVEFTKENESPLKAEIELDNGFYYFVVTDSDGNSSAPEAFRIVNGDSLNAEVYLYNTNLGSFRVTIINSITPNPTLNLSVSDSTIHEGEEFTISATGMSGESLVYSWYVNGKAVEGSGSSINLSMEFAGDYTVRCLVRDTASSIVWSSDKTITVHDAEYKPTELILSGEIETWIIGDVLFPGDLVVTLKENGSGLMAAQYGHGHRTFSLGDNSTLSCDLSGVEGYSYYFETEVADDGSTIVYIVIDKEIENPAYLRITFDYDYIFNKERNEYKGFFICPQGVGVESERSGIVSLTNNTATRTIKVEPDSYRRYSYTGSNCNLYPSASISSFVAEAGEIVEMTVTLPYCRIVLKDTEIPFTSSSLISEQNGIDYVYLDSYGDDISFIVGNIYSGSDTFSLWNNSTDYLYSFDATIAMGETIEVTPERVDANYVTSETIIPAGRVVVKSTSSVLFENSMWPYFKVSDSSRVTIGKGNLDCRHSYKFNSSSEMIIAFANLLGNGYTYEVSLKNAEDEEGEYTEVTVNVSKDIENYAILRVSTEIDEKLVSAHGTLISLQINGDGDILLLPFWSTETYDL